MRKAPASITEENRQLAVVDSPPRRWSDEVQEIPIRCTGHVAAGGWLLPGCSGVLPATLQEKLATTDNAEDHLAAAMLYQNKARELEAEAEEYERAVSTLESSGDSKGFHYGALRMAAQKKRHEAKQMQKLYASHAAQAQALALHGKAQPQ